MTDTSLFDIMAFRIITGLVVGLALGSFATMLSYRLPRKISIIHPPSSCPQCHARLRKRDLVPFFSWAASGGKCRHCGGHIGIRYPLIELATATICVLAFAIIGFQPHLALVLALTVIFITTATILLESKN